MKSAESPTPKKPTVAQLQKRVDELEHYTFRCWANLLELATATGPLLETVPIFMKVCVEMFANPKLLQKQLDRASFDDGWVRLNRTIKTKPWEPLTTDELGEVRKMLENLKDDTNGTHAKKAEKTPKTERKEEKGSQDRGEE